MLCLIGTMSISATAAPLVRRRNTYGSAPPVRTRKGSENAIARLVDEILLLAIWKGAVEVTFEIQHLDSHGGYCLAEPPNFHKELQFQDLLNQGGEEHLRFSINYRTADQFVELDTPPIALYGPIVRRLCAMADIPYWHYGWIETLLQLEFGEEHPRWMLVRDNVRKRVYLRPATDEETNDFVARPIRIRGLNDSWQPLPRHHWHLMFAPNFAYAACWCFLRMVFYTMTAGVLWTVSAAGGLCDALVVGIKPFLFAGLALSLPAHWLFTGYRRFEETCQHPPKPKPSPTTK